MAGEFYNYAGFTTYNYVALWNGTLWSELGANSPNHLHANNIITSICSDISGNIYAAGWFTDSSGTHGHQYVAKWDGSNWGALGTGANALNPAYPNPINALLCDANQNIYAGGIFTDSLGYAFVAKYTASTGINTVNEVTNNFSIYPNPTANALTLKTTEPLTNATIQVSNILGEIIFTKQNQSGNQFTLDLINQLQGIYFIQVQQQGNVWRGKVVKE